MVVVSADSPLKGIADVGGSDEEEEEDEVGVWADVWVVGYLFEAHGNADWHSCFKRLS